MKKNFLLFLSFIALTMLMVGCTGVNGNPSELTGSWLYTKSDEVNGENNHHVYKLTISQDGRFTIDYERRGDSAYRNATIKGYVLGNVIDNPKTIMFNTGEIYADENKNDTEGGSTGSVNGKYYMSWIHGKRHLILSDNIYFDVGFPVTLDGKYSKQ